MNIKYVCPFWGQEGIAAKDFIKKVKEAGYDAVEMNIPESSSFENDLKKILPTSGIELISQQWLEPLNESVDSYIKRLEKRLYKLVEFNPIFINSHTGRDFYTLEENTKILERIFLFEKETNVPVYHETHRGRFNYCAQSFSNFQKIYPNLKLTADFSHWTVVSETLLHDQQESLSKATDNSHYFHARVADTQRSQVHAPFAEENKVYLETFFKWWQEILQKAIKKGIETFYICPEFGPIPYMQTITNSSKPIIDQWELNIEMMKYLKKNL
ncbi:sugar phosphate isomerase/epimerase [Joostella atrarenae]|uniref:Sugar phosphate isomerase/epimerase n=1 Tax=Joostella atrarenae TaxID=679257 RepID=A0ABS9J734_9FLAO|nr:sugar phosphate isomerase/epimerase [Joostella atrarenae]MCF8716246.1 sugar phosphate isomerase/epimerase [Joostella atrarenae]